MHALSVRGAASLDIGFGPRVCSGFDSSWQVFQIDRRWREAEVVDVSNGSILTARLVQELRALPESDGPTRTRCGTRGPASTARSSVRAQVALFRLVAAIIEADCTVRARQHAFLTSGTTIVVDFHDARIRMLGDGVGPARPQTCRAAALLANGDGELEPTPRFRGRYPVDAIAKDPLHQTVLELACRFARPAPRTSLEIDRQNEFHSMFAFARSTRGEPPRSHYRTGESSILSTS